MAGAVVSADEMSREWLESVLHAQGVAPPDAELADYVSATIGTGKVGENVRFELAWEGAGAAGAPRTVVGKFASTDPVSRRAGLLTGIYVREVGFYRELAHLVDITVPRCLWSEIDVESGEFTLLLEDLGPARQGDQMEGCTADEAALALEELAGLHAPLHQHAALDKHDWLVERRAGRTALAGVYAALLPGFMECYAHRLHPDVLDTAQRFAPNVAAWLETDALPFTLVHGDYRLENMMFGTKEGGHPLAVVDWQTVAVGPAVSDVAYFLGAGLPVELRRAHEVDLVRVWHEAMTARGVDLAWDECWAGYRANAFAGLHMAVVASQLVGRDARSDEMFCVMAERHAAAVGDLDAFEIVE